MAIEGESYDPYRIRRLELSRVCHHWREIILNTPKFWSFIRLESTWPKSLVEVHIHKSGQLPLDIVLGSRSHRLSYMSKSNVDDLLDTLIPTAHRWNSLVIEDSRCAAHFSTILNRLDSAVFPILTRLCVNTDRIDPYQPRFLSTQKFTMLTDLKLLYNIGSVSGFQIFPTLERLTLGLAYAGELDTWLPSLSSLKALSLGGRIENFPLIQPNSIHLPFLARFTCHVTHAELLLQALLAPNLTHLDYSQSHSESLYRVFNGIQSKFISVRELRLRLPTSVTATSDSDGLISLCLAAPEVRGIEVVDHVLNALLGVRFDPCPIDQWEHLERVAVITSVHKLKTMQRMVPWLKRRRTKTGKRRLKIGFSVEQDSRAKLKRALFGEIRKFCDEVDFRMEKRIAPLMSGYTPCTISDDNPRSLTASFWY